MVGRRYHREGPGRAVAEGRLRDLGRDLDRRRAQARRQWRHWQATRHEPQSLEAAEAAKGWSDTIDQALHIAEPISREPAYDLNELVIKFEAAWWWILEDDSLLDNTARLWLMRFRRSLPPCEGQVGFVPYSTRKRLFDLSGYQGPHLLEGYALHERCDPPGHRQRSDFSMCSFSSSSSPGS